MKETEKNISILDCTLRDGSYIIDYQFTIEDTYMISLGLERAGFRLIEIGHGTGMGSTKAGRGKASATDEEYLAAAHSALSGSDAKFGMLFIPGIGRMEDLQLVADYGMNFVRVGTNITEIEEAKPYIEKAKAIGFHVSSNLMKSYAVSVDEFVRRAKLADEYGVDIITVVDSAGGMLPEEVREYVLRLKDVTDKQIGFHGHNNLHLAITNTLEAIKAGASVVDSSLQGMGRSAGNAQTEVLVMVLEKLGYHTGIDVFKTMDLGMRLIRPAMSRNQGVDDMSLVAGIAQFHSSFSQIIDDAAKKHDVDPRRLIIEVSKIEKVNVTRELAEKTALRIKENLKKDLAPPSVVTVNISAIKSRETKSPIDQAQSIANELFSQSKKTRKESVFAITLSHDGQTSFPFIRQSSSLVIGNVEVQDIEVAKCLIATLDGLVNWLLLDECPAALRESGLEKKIRKSHFTWYSEERALRSSIWALLSQNRPRGAVLLLSDKENVDLLKLSLSRGGISVMTMGDIHRGKDHGKPSKSVSLHQWGKILSQTSTIISFDEKYARGLSGEHVKLLPYETEIYAVRPHAFPESFWNTLFERKLPVYRVDTRSAFAAELSLVIETKKMTDVMGSAEFCGTTLVAGGVIGARGSIVVDSIKKPDKVIGIADGMGGLLSPEEETPFLKLKESVQAELLKRVL
jgi:4-hydroxy-2-oxovalerate aldolase